MAIPAEKFIRVWQSSTSNKQAAATLGMSRSVCTQRAYYLRKKGIPLQKFPALMPARLDYRALAKLAASIKPKK